MKVECQERFMVRTPYLPIEYLAEYEQQELDIYEFVKSRKNLDEFFKKALYISSPSLYQTYVHGAKTDKKYQDLKNSLLKYFLRSVGRPTPYGYYATVSLGTFGDSTELVRGKDRIDIRPDFKWLNKLIEKLESEPDVIKRLYVKFNPICFVSGDRMKNPYYSSYGDASGRGEKVTENNIRNTALVTLVSALAKEYVQWDSLVSAVKERYEDVTEEQVSATLLQLLKNEYLISNLRIPTYCKDALTYVLEQLNRIGYKTEVYEELLSIQKLIREYSETNDQALLTTLYRKMGEVVEAKQYLILNLGNDMLKCSVSEDVKIQIESLAGTLAKFPVKYNATGKLQEAFTEQYGSNVEVPLIEIIDHNGFDGLRYVDMSAIDEQGEDKIRSIIDNRIQIAICNQEKVVSLTEEDFADVLSKEDMLCSYDINFFMTEEKKGIKLWIGPNFGSSTAGAMTQRFSGCLPKAVMCEYNKLYEKIAKNSDFEMVEIREFKSNSTFENVVNTGRNYKYFFPIGMVNENTEDEIKLKDIVVGINERGMYLRSKRLNKRLKFVTDNMLNPMLHSELSRLLLGISGDYEKHPLTRLSLLPTHLRYKYVPRIELNDVVISPRRWFAGEADLQAKSMEEFAGKLEQYRKNYKIDTRVYCQDADNRIMVDLTKHEYIEILYQEFKKTKKLEFTELELSSEGGYLVKDVAGNGYINECVFTVIHQSKEADEGENLSGMDRLLCEKERRRGLCEDGWVYFKLYGVGTRSRELLTVRLKELIEKLDYTNHFFIRYADEQGEHLRIRFKFRDERHAYEQLPVINEYLKELINEKLITNVIFDTYYREINRYGGHELIDSCEELFFKDSETVEELLSHYDMNETADLEKVYMTGITFLLKHLTESEQDMFDVIDSDKRKENYRKDYRENAKRYMKYVEDVLADRIFEEGEAKAFWVKEADAARQYAEELQRNTKKGMITNARENIILSIVHMYCNRMTGNRAVEAKYLELVRDALYQLLQRKRYGKKE